MRVRFALGATSTGIQLGARSFYVDLLDFTATINLAESVEPQLLKLQWNECKSQPIILENRVLFVWVSCSSKKRGQLFLDCPEPGSLHHNRRAPRSNRILVLCESSTTASCYSTMWPTALKGAQGCTVLYNIYEMT